MLDLRRRNFASKLREIVAPVLTAEDDRAYSVAEGFQCGDSGLRRRRDGIIDPLDTVMDPEHLQSMRETLEIPDCFLRDGFWDLQEFCNGKGGRDVAQIMMTEEFRLLYAQRRFLPREFDLLPFRCFCDILRARRK